MERARQRPFIGAAEATGIRRAGERHDHRRAARTVRAASPVTPEPFFRGDVKNDPLTNIRSSLIRPPGLQRYAGYNDMGDA